MIFLFLLFFGVFFLFVNIRPIARGNKGSIAAGLIVLVLPVCFMFRSHFWACVLQAFFSVWLCEALLAYLAWWIFRGVRRLVLRRALPLGVKALAARVLLAFTMTLSAIMCAVGYGNNADYKSKKLVVETEGAPFTALFFTDLHIDPLFDRAKVERMVREASEIKPDVILFGGDFADVHDSVMTQWGYDSLMRAFTATARAGAFAVNGNHEGFMERSGSDPNGWLRKNGFVVLDDSTACLEFACFTGRTDFQVARMRGVERKSLSALVPLPQPTLPSEPLPVADSAGMDSAQAPSAGPWILLDHQPKGIEKEYSGRLPDLALSGHTHDGQFFPGTVVINWVWRLAYGYGILDNVKWLVSSGIDSWGPPVRIGSETEMWLLEFRRN